MTDKTSTNTSENLVTGTAVTATFSQPMDPATVNSLTFTVKETTGGDTSVFVADYLRPAGAAGRRKPECISNALFGLHNLRHSFGNWAQANQGKETSERRAADKETITHRGIDA